MKKGNIFIYVTLILIVLLNVVSINKISAKNAIVKTIAIKDEKEVVLFAGDSITDGYRLSEYYNYNDKVLINSGISGYRTTNILARIDNVIYQYQADKLFLLIGTNDINKGTDSDEIVENIKEIIRNVKKNNPNTKIYLESIYPINEEKISKANKRTNKKIRYINSKLEEYAKENDITYINLYTPLLDNDNQLNKDYTGDGLHLNSKGYEVVTKELKKYVER